MEGDWSPLLLVAEVVFRSSELGMGPQAFGVEEIPRYGFVTARNCLHVRGVPVAFAKGLALGVYLYPATFA